MTTGARTPDELDGLLEDALVVGDRAGLDALFDQGAVLADDDDEVRGAEAITRALAGRTYVAATRRVVRAGDTALVVAEGAIHVLRRGGDGAWRAAISLLAVPAPDRSEDA